MRGTPTRPRALLRAAEALAADGMLVTVARGAFARVPGLRRESRAWP